IPVIACALHYPILVTCTAQFVLSVYSIVNTGEKVEYRLLHQLISFICKPPLDISLEEKDDEGRDKSGEWRIIVAYATGVYGGGWTVGIQEILFNSTSITSTTHCSPQISSSVFSFAPITTISYKSSHLITAHSDNTIQLFHVMNSDNILQCTHTQTLYGHTGSVQAVAIDEYGKLISGAMDQSIKIWDLGIREKAEEDMEEKKGWGEQEYKEKEKRNVVEAVMIMILNTHLRIVNQSMPMRRYSCASAQILCIQVLKYMQV
ncbi:1313_t:CDS:2, partial [Paraglomus occultum]